METEHYIDLLERYGQVSYGMRAYLRVVLKTEVYQKHQRLSLSSLTHGQYALIADGAMRLFASGDENLSENTLAFWFKDNFIPCFGNGRTPFAGHLSIEFMADTQILSIPEKHALSILKLFRESAKIFQASHWEQQSHLIDQLLIRNSLSAATGYEAILRLQPDIAKKATVRDIASFLGIDERTLSRIRAGRQQT